MELTDAIRRNPMSRFQWVIVAICILLTMVDGYEILVTSFTLPALTEHFGLDRGQQGLVASFGTLGMGIGAIFLSPLADRIGRRNHILASLAIIVVAMTLTGLATSFETFLAFRFFGGLFLGAIVPSINVLVAEYANQKRRGAVMGVYGIGLPLGAAIGGFLSLSLIDAFTWRGPYFFSAIITAVLLVVAAVVLPESVDYLVQKRPAGALRAYNKIARRIGVPESASLPVPTRPAPAKGAFVSGVFRGIMLRRTILLWISYGLVIAAFYFANGLTAKLVTETTGDADFGITAQALVAAGGVIGALLFSLASRRIHPRLVTAGIGVVGFVVFFAFAAFFDRDTMVLVLAVMVGLAVNGGVAAYYAISPSIYPVAVRAAAVGLMMGLGRAVAFFAPNVATFLQERGLSPADLYQLYGVVLLLSAVAVALLHATYRGVHSRDAMDEEDDAAETASLEAEARAAGSAAGQPVG
ncbi:MFS transporter [Nocardioides marmotae]|uniref:MFS transporter n=1 Tax=Nocardioides marmotae TaxID=2663857 RepID=A0A6I3JE84_9ACTN|nr:MFS transporter [Nocardioides marmotae]MCR6032864.1 MFS transporter [Gordonia jinghuaiqii]MBC9735213.1 MFS transporter [Nocardioides marmotae]MTB86313.1 MFS transporter [Nocardioides marmotae]MTB96514.1 MFS transporter [Nocardioides marmotae]QKE01964.1 MFS transporter [Nocardioides marmotae]